MSVIIKRHLFTVDDYYRMGEAGIFDPEERVELVGGEIVTMGPIRVEHAACVDRLNDWLVRTLRGASVRVQNPIHLDEHNEPQPDLAVVRRRKDFYAKAHPTPADILLVIEVSDTTLAYDRGVKLPLYARAGILETWLVNLDRDWIEQYAQPVNGAYTVRREVKRGETLTSVTVAELSCLVEEILG